MLNDRSVPFEQNVNVDEPQSQSQSQSKYNNTLVVSDKTSSEEICNDIAALWNEMALLNALPKVKTPLSKDRQKKMALAIKEFRDYPDWLKIINAVVDNDFNLGVNDRKWKANFDWLFHSTKFNYRKLWESSNEENN